MRRTKAQEQKKFKNQTNRKSPTLPTKEGEK